MQCSVVPLAIAALASALSAQDPTVIEGLPWRRDLDLARAEARRDHKPLLVVFRCEQ